MWGHELQDVDFERMMKHDEGYLKKCERKKGGTVRGEPWLMEEGGRVGARMSVGGGGWMGSMSKSRIVLRSPS